MGTDNRKKENHQFIENNKREGNELSIIDSERGGGSLLSESISDD